MSERYKNLKKIPNEPAARILSHANTRLDTALTSPPAAPVAQVLAELEDAGAPLDIMRLLSVALPQREVVWWACLAARDLLENGAERVPRPLAAAEAWVFRPGDETREAVRVAAEQAEFDDDTVFCARAAMVAASAMNPAETDDGSAPPGAAAGFAQAMNFLSLNAHADAFESHLALLIDRALDIARGGNGRLDGKTPGGVAG